MKPITWRDLVTSPFNMLAFTKLLLSVQAKRNAKANILSNIHSNSNHCVDIQNIRYAKRTQDPRNPNPYSARTRVAYPACLAHVP